MFLIRRIEDKTAGSVMRALTRLQQQYGNRWDVLFKTITTDNRSEFTDLSKLEQSSRTRVYHARPYASYNKEEVERHNRMIRRYIPKGCVDENSEQPGYCSYSRVDEPASPQNPRL